MRFKQFLEGELDDLPAEMWLRHHLKVDQEAAEDALAWLRQKDNWLSDATWQKMVRLAKTYPNFPEFFYSNDQEEDAVRFVLAKAMLAADIKLVEGRLEDLPVELFFSHIIGLPKDEVEEAMNWFNGPLDVEGARTDFYDHLIDWLEDNLDGQPSIYTRPRSGGTTENIVRQRLRKKMIKMGALSEGTLEDLPIEMAIRKETGADQYEAEAVLAWFRGEEDDEQETVAYNLMINYYADDLMLHKIPHDEASEYVREWFSTMLKRKYKLEIYE